MSDEKRPMTLSGYSKIASEYKQLWDIERPKVVSGIADAAAEGDRSENAEYIYGKKRLRELDKRLRYLTYLLTDVEIIDPSTLSGDVVCFGCTVQIRDENDETKRWTIVGEGESDSRNGTISWKSPLAKALLGKRVGTVVQVELPNGDHEIEITGMFFGSRSYRD
jgi:transcription elongation factor GreB